MTLSHFCGEGRGNAESTIACSPDMPRCGIIRGFCPRRINKKGNGCCLFMAEGEGFALQRLPIGNAKGTIACSPGDERSAPGISKTSPSKIKKNPCRFFLWRKARDSNPRILSHQRFSSFIFCLFSFVCYCCLTDRIIEKSAF